MTPKQEAFVREYLIDLCATKAAERVGYSGKHVKKTASDLMQKPEIQAAIAKAQAARAERTEDSQDEVLRDCRRVGQRAEREGKYDAALRAIELRGRHLGMFKQTVDIPGGLTVIVKDYTGRKTEPDAAD